MTNALTRRALLGASLFGLVGCGQPPPATGNKIPSGTSNTPHQRLIGEATLPHRMDVQGTVVGGLSAIDYDPASGLYVLVSDDRSQLNPARFYTARIALTATGLGTPVLHSVTPLLRADGSPFPNSRRAQAHEEVPDPEAIRWLPSGNLLWTSEGAVTRGMGPALYESQADGRWVKEFLRMKSPAGKEVYWLTGEFQNHHPVQDDSDTVALEAGYASLVPCKIDVTDYAYLNRFKQWEIEEQGNII